MHKYDISFGEGGGGKEKKVFVKGELENKLGPMIDKEGTETLSLVMSIVGRF